MNIFGGAWENYLEEIEKSWEENVSDDDLVLISGDISWAMKMQDVIPDLDYIGKLKGKKVIIRGNHDYWWSTAAKFEKFCAAQGFGDMHVLNNNFYEYNDIAICGTRGWFFEENRSGEHDEKVFKRELGRLETSLKAAGEKQKIVFLHYPPRYKGYECTEILDLLKTYGVRQCFYGHLHGPSHALAQEGQWDGIEFRLVAADRLQFIPWKVME